MRRQDRGQRDAFEAEMLPYVDTAYRLARALTGQQQDAEDLVQETYLRAFVGFGGYRRNTNARAWLLTILRRIYLNDCRRARVRPLIFRLAEPGEPGEPADTQAPGPEEETLRGFDSRIVMRELAQLPEPCRSTLALVDLDQMQYAEAATILGCPVGRVMSRLHRGRLALARRLRSAQIRLEAG